MLAQQTEFEFLIPRDLREPQPDRPAHAQVLIARSRKHEGEPSARGHRLRRIKRAVGSGERAGERTIRIAVNPPLGRARKFEEFSRVARHEALR